MACGRRRDWLDARLWCQHRGRCRATGGGSRRVLDFGAADTVEPARADPLRRVQPLLITALVALAAGLVGAFAANRLMQPTPTPSVHDIVHRELDLTSVQDARIEALEARFAGRRAALEAELKQANRELAEAIVAEQGYGPRVTAAVDHFHRVMGQLQKETLEHMFRMRAVLNARQAARFDETVGKALTANAG